MLSRIRTTGSPQPVSSGSRHGFTLIELLVVIAIIGVLVSLLMPAVQQARAAARRTQCRNNLKQIALALHGFHDTERAFPPARLVLNELVPENSAGTVLGADEPSWMVRILPYLEQNNLASLWDVDTPFGAHSTKARSTAVSTLLCPDRHSVSTAVTADTVITINFPCGCPGGVQNIPGGALTDYAGNMGDPSPGASGLNTDFYWGGKGTGVLISSRPKPVDPDFDIDSVDRVVSPFGIVFEPSEYWNGWLDRVRIADITDGTTNTLMVGEAHIPTSELNRSPYNGAAYFGRHTTHFARIAGPGFPLAHSPNDQRANVYSFGSSHAGGVQFALADGSVRLISSSISSRVLGHLANRGDGQVVSEY